MLSKASSKRACRPVEETIAKNLTIRRKGRREILRHRSSRLQTEKNLVKQRSRAIKQQWVRLAPTTISKQVSPATRPSAPRNLPRWTMAESIVKRRPSRDHRMPVSRIQTETPSLDPIGTSSLLRLWQTYQRQSELDSTRARLKGSKSWQHHRISRTLLASRRQK